MAKKDKKNKDSKKNDVTAAIAIVGPLKGREFAIQLPEIRVKLSKDTGPRTKKEFKRMVNQVVKTDLAALIASVEIAIQEAGGKTPKTSKKGKTDYALFV